MTDYDDVEILLVEDSDSDAEMTMRAFKRSNFVNRLYRVRDGVEALDFVMCRGAFADRDANQMPKVLLLDLKMPRLNGLDVLRELKSRPETKAIPVVVMTSSHQDRDIEQCYQLGVNGYVTKPVQFDSFSEAIANIGMYWLTVNEVKR
jgi:CheY-like chemotaxis protein